MGSAFGWGLLAGSSLVIGGLIGLGVPVGRRALGLIMAFGSGVLISAVAYSLVLEAVETTAGGGGVGLGLAAGALAFYAGDLLLDRYGADDRKRSSGTQAAGAPLAIVLGIVLDGIPESIVIGLSLLGGGEVSVAVITAVFLSNLPEAIAATTGLVESGWARSRILGLWVVVALVSALAAVVGYVALDGASPRTIAFVLAFAGGAILTMLADTMMPEAFEHGGKQVGLLTTLGFGLGLVLTAFE
jgi:zinc transporter, ZIP family